MLPFAGPGGGGQTGWVADDQTSTVRGDAELIARAGHLFDAVHEEFACAARDLATWSQPEARSAVARRVLAHGPDVGFTVRKLMSPLVLADEAQRAHLLRLHAAGSQVRISRCFSPVSFSARRAALMRLASVDSETTRPFQIASSRSSRVTTRSRWRTRNSIISKTCGSTGMSSPARRSSRRSASSTKSSN